MRVLLKRQPRAGHLAFLRMRQLIPIVHSINCGQLENSAETKSSIGEVAVGGSSVPPKVQAQIGKGCGLDLSASATNASEIHASLVAACSQSTIMAIKTRIGPRGISFAVDTGAAVNVLSEEAYCALKWVSHGGQYRLSPNDHNLMGMTCDLDILGVVHLPVNLGKGTPTTHSDFYVASNFGLPLMASWV
ncbi:hypothetical protein E2C01_030136 [Portunus trituberculatus]|uniref:Peptidase A2 domain-containing protein n=1 Tax=Portunus trituberculatus TaxID=210409 RepID=A0A5B7EUJ0_PORTR|nr:hypothetical protein [Portunus trituberculatus]